MTERGPAGPRPYRVLVVDDNQDAADTLALLVRIWGHDARVAYDGVEGLRTACAFQPDCLVLDIGLPKLDGYSLAQQIRQGAATAHMKLIALTAYSDEEHCRRDSPVHSSGYAAVRVRLAPRASATALCRSPAS